MYYSRVEDWKYITTEPEEALARLHFFSVKKPYPGGEVELRITIREFSRPDIGALQFYAETDQMLNQGTAPFRPCGWGKTLSEALSDCLRNIRRFDYEAGQASSA